MPRPDLIIVARGGGSIEDLWGFNEEIVVRAAAASDIPLISAVGHETDTTLIDHAADLRAPTPTAAAELAVPVRLELLAWAADQGARMDRAALRRAETSRQRLRDLARALGRPETLLDAARQRVDGAAARLGPALRTAATTKRAQFNASAALMRPTILTRFLAQERRVLGDRATRLTAALTRLHREAARDTQRQRAELGQLAARLHAAPRARLTTLAQRLEAIDRTRLTLGYTETLRRGFVVVRGARDGLVTSRNDASRETALELEFHDGRLAVVAGGGATPPQSKPTPKRKPRSEKDQGSLF